MNESSMAYPGKYNDQMHFGMTKREVFLKDVLAGLCANPNFSPARYADEEGQISYEDLVAKANAITDAVFRNG